MKDKQAIYILGGGLIKENNKWRTTNFNDGDNFGAMGDRLRIDAAYVLYKKNSNLILITSCGKGQYKDIPDAPTVAEVMKQELIELGIEDSKILKEEKSGNTWRQLQELKNIIKNNNLDKIYILSNRHHLPRVQAMIEVDNVLYEMLKRQVIELVSAEEVLIENNPDKWTTDIDNAYQTEAMKKRLDLEAQGVMQIREGIYNLH